MTGTQTGVRLALAATGSANVATGCRCSITS